MAIIGKNLEKGSNEAAIPSAYKLEHINITNYRGDTSDIKNLAVKMEITESLYTQSLTLKLTLKDSTNLIEEFPIIGQEKVEVIISFKRKKNPKKPEKPDIKKIKLNFYITEYPTYGSTPSNFYVQVISLFGISEQSYISNQKKISRKYINNTANEIEKILTEELDLPSKKFISSEDAISSSRGIISNQRPMDVIEWFRKQTYSENTFSPFFFFQTLNGKFKLFSLASLISEDNKVLDRYKDLRDVFKDPNTVEDFRQREERILSVSSDLKLNKSIQSRRGAFASKNNYLDYGNKTYTKFEYNYKKDFLDKPSLEGKKILSDEFLIGDDKLTDFTQAHCEYISVNSKAFDGNTNYNDMSKISRHFINAYNALFNTFTHDIRLNGNFKLNAGRKIELEFQKAIDPSVYRDFVNNPKSHHRNEFLSGKYLITSAVHEFDNDEYHVNLRVKRDSFSIDV
jgi:hypothetical protein